MYSDQDRNIYQFPDGSQFADPIAIHRRLIIALNGDVNQALDQAEHENPVVKARAELQLADASRVAFNLPYFNPEDGSGLTDEEVLFLLRDYLSWREKNG